MPRCKSDLNHEHPTDSEPHHREHPSMSAQSLMTLLKPSQNHTLGRRRSPPPTATSDPM
ncbi:hypothetical protein RHGRI_029534 [Rhododendron griersonianum]|uniref:Uncharacterized protein n=1 Tax=Rhododendron griersonianum TaxID=479676 RepID=A0AAV6IM11_9ERIC|nr:hypothetical protein RHGRI_029534 [Rhododendron griersonianum]